MCCWDLFLHTETKCFNVLTLCKTRPLYQPMRYDKPHSLQGCKFYTTMCCWDLFLHTETKCFNVLTLCKTRPLYQPMRYDKPHSLQGCKFYYSTMCCVIYVNLFLHIETQVSNVLILHCAKPDPYQPTRYDKPHSLQGCKFYNIMCYICDCELIPTHWDVSVSMFSHSIKPYSISAIEVS